MNQINFNSSNLQITLSDDYVDTIIKCVQACALPTYAAADKMVDPPMVAVRFGQDIFIKGIITGAVGVTYGLPILRNGKYAQISLSFAVYETDPYDAKIVAEQGSFRGMDNFTLTRGLFKSPA